MRFFEIDFLRGIAILMMVWFHFLWNLNFFGFIKISLYEGFWGLFQIVTASTFLFLVGVSLSISYHRTPLGFGKRFFSRGIKIFLWGILITIFSLIFFPSSPIFFGILHLIGFSVIVLIPLVKKNYLNLFIGALIIFSTLFFNFSSLEIKSFAWLGISKSAPALDFFPVLPWIGVVLLGLFFGNNFYSKHKSLFEIKKPQNRIVDLLVFFGKNSLFIYFIHQLILFPLVGIARFFV